jgi:4-amino-4-deoxy-L-arabinose transferase-like glycosyltransferase
LLQGAGFLVFSPHLVLIAILLIFFTLATLYSVIVPITQGEDELAHFRYISFISQTGRLPTTYAEREVAWYRADWPPLYHLLVGWAVSPIDTTQPHLKDVGETPRRRLVGEIFYPRLIIYTADATWPWQDGILAWHLGRFISILFSGVALIFTYLTTLELGRAAEKEPIIGRSRLLAAPLFAGAVTALLAFTPRFLFTSAMLGDDSLFILLSAVFIWLLLRALRGDDRWRVYAAMGLLLGLSIATKYSTGLLPLVLIPVVWWRAGQARWRWPQAVGRLLLAWGGTIVGASWWFGWIGLHFNTIKENGLFFGLLSPLLASGPDVSMRRVFAFFTGSGFTGAERPDAVEAGTLWDWLTYLFQTFWGVPVLEHDPLFPWAYLLLMLFCLAALVGLGRLWARATAPLRMTLGVLLLVVALLFPFPILRFFLTHNVLETGQGRHILYPAAQAIPILLMLGWLQLISGRRIKDRESVPVGPASPVPGRGLAFYAGLIPALLLVWSMFQLVYMARTYPDPLPVQTTTFDPASIPQPLRHQFGQGIGLLGYDFKPDPDQAIINLTLFWEAVQPVEENYRTRVRLVDPAGEVNFTWLSQPVNGLYPTRAWDQGDVIRDELPLPLAGVSPAHYTIQLDWLLEADDTPLVEEPLSFIEFDLPTRQPIPDPASMAGIDYRLWVDETPVRPRQTVALSFTGLEQTNRVTRQTQTRTWSLVGPDALPRYPAALSEATAIFMVGPDWPSGDYRLQLEQPDADLVQSGPQLAVANQARLFSLPEAIKKELIPVEAVFAGPQDQPQVKLLGYELPTRRVQPGGGLPVVLYWQSLAPVLADTITFAVLLDADQNPHGNVDRYPSGFYSPILWAEGEIVADTFTIPVRPDAPPGVYSLHVGQYQLTGGQPTSLPLWRAGEVTEETAVVIQPLKVGGPPPGVTTDKPDPQVPVNQTLGQQITLLGYTTHLTPDSELNITLYWRAETNPSVDYTTFLHLRNAAGDQVAQKDSPPATGRYPTQLWETGEVIVDEIRLSLEGVPPGEVTPVVGLYELATGARLAVPGSPHNEIQLRPVLIPAESGN